MTTLIDDLLPRYDFNEVHSVEIAASAEVVYAALFTVDLGSPLIVRALMGLRSLPSWLQGSRRSDGRKPLTLREINRAGFTLLGENPPREVVLGTQGAFWKLRPDMCSIDAAAFGAPLPTGVARAAWNFRVESLGPGQSRLATETRILCGDPASRRRFGLYWTFVQPGSGIIRRAILAAVKEESRERSTGR